MIMGHRGADYYAKENTLKSIKLAMEQQADMIEIDVRQSWDNHLMLFHDNVLNWKTWGNGIFHTKTRDYLDGVRYIDGSRIPSLQQAMNMLAKGDAKVCLDIKSLFIDIDNFYNVVAERKMLNRVNCTSFFQNVIRKYKDLNPKSDATLVAFFGTKKFVNDAVDIGATHVSPFIISRNVVDYAHDNRLKVISWPTLTRFQLERNIRLGVDVISTGRPDQTRLFLKNFASSLNC